MIPITMPTASHSKSFQLNPLPHIRSYNSLPSPTITVRQTDAQSGQNADKTRRIIRLHKMCNAPSKEIQSKSSFRYLHIQPYKIFKIRINGNSCISRTQIDNIVLSVVFPVT